MAKQYKSTDIVNTAQALIYNKFVLYFVFVVALLNLLFSATKRDYLFCAIFILTGFIVAFFNKNMTVILVCTIAIANIVSTLVGGGKRQFEGMKESIETEEESEGKEEKEESFTLSPEKKEKSVDLSAESKAPAPASKSADTAASVASDSIDSTANKKRMVNQLKNEAQDLLEVQQKIIKGFEKIEPEMTRAEKLINQINATAKQIQAFQGMGAAN